MARDVAEWSASGGSFPCTVAWRFDGGFGRAGVIGAESAAGDLSPWLHLCAGKPPRPLRTKGREGACATHV